jgi:hypothetical protein
MAIPTNRNDFKEYCLRKLGKPVIEINVDDDQVDDRINKYLKLYMKIVLNALQFPKTSQYKELHHILPVCLFPEYKNLNKNPINGVYLTAKQHFICHLLLVKVFYGDDKKRMWWAFNGMRRSLTCKRYFNSKLYERMKINHFTGHTEEAIKKFSESMRGKEKSLKHKRNLSISQKNIIRVMSEEHRKALIEANKRPKSEEHKRKIGLAHKDRPGKLGKENPMFGKVGELNPNFGKKQTLEHKEKRLSKIRGRNQSAEARLKMSQNRHRGTSGKRWFNDGLIETFDLPDNKPKNFNFGRLKRI